MSLNWSVQKVRDWQALAADKNEAAITEVVILATMGVDIGEITEKNWVEFYARMKFLETLNGPWLRDGDDKPYLLTPQMVKRRIGLKANVVDLTRAKWLRGVSKVIGFRLDSYAFDAEKEDGDV